MNKLIVISSLIYVTFLINFRSDLHIFYFIIGIVSRLFNNNFFCSTKYFKNLYIYHWRKLHEDIQQKTNIILVQSEQYSIVKLLLNKSEYRQRIDVSNYFLYTSVNELVWLVRAISLLKIVIQHTSPSKYHKIRVYNLIIQD